MTKNADCRKCVYGGEEIAQHIQCNFFDKKIREFPCWFDIEISILEDERSIFQSRPGRDNSRICNAFKEKEE